MKTDTVPEIVVDGTVVAKAHVNIALIKYWGKAPARAPGEENLPAVPSLSLTLSGLYTETRVGFAPDLEADAVELDGRALVGEERARACLLLDAVREMADVASPLRVVSRNHVPTAAGLASSASGMAALAAAAARCAGLDLSPEELSALARRGSGSASRSVFGGWVAWEGPSARAVAPPEHWDVAVVVAMIGTGRKKLGSREAMTRTARTSPFYAGWVGQAGETFRAAEAAVMARDLEGLIAAMELSTLRMHAVGMAASPPVLYWEPATLAVLREVERLRADGIPCGYTMDAGPNVKVFCRAAHAAAIAERLTKVDGVGHTMTCGPGEGVQMRVETQVTW